VSFSFADVSMAFFLGVALGAWVMLELMKEESGHDE